MAIAGMRMAAAGLAWAAACGEVKGTAEDAGTLIDAEDDGNEPPPRCRPESDFGAPEPLEALNSDETVYDEGASLSADERRIYLSSDRAGSFDLYFATRDDRDGEFSPPVPIRGLNDPKRRERHPAISHDELQLLAQIGPNDDLDIWLATRADPDQDFQWLEAPPGLNSESANDYTPYSVGAAKTVYFASTRDSGTTSDIWRATWNGTGFDPPSKVEGVDLVTESEESNPVVTTDELTLFFDSNRTGELLDIYVATRGRATDEFGPATRLVDLSGDGRDFPTWISPDGCVLYLTQQAGASGPYKMFVAKRAPP